MWIHFYDCRRVVECNAIVVQQWRYYDESENVILLGMILPLMFKLVTIIVVVLVAGKVVAEVIAV